MKNLFLIFLLVGYINGSSLFDKIENGDINMTAVKAWEFRDTIKLEAKEFAECKNAYELINNAKSLSFNATVKDLQKAILDSDVQMVASIIKQNPKLIVEKIENDDPKFRTIFLTFTWNTIEKYKDFDDMKPADKNIGYIIGCSDDFSIYWREIYPFELVVDENSSDEDVAKIFDEMFKSAFIDKDVVFFSLPSASLLEMTYTTNSAKDNRSLTFERILKENPKVYNCSMMRFVEIGNFLEENGFKFNVKMAVTDELKEFIKSKKWIDFIDNELKFTSKLLKLGQSYECCHIYEIIFETIGDKRSLEILKNLGKKTDKIKP